MTDHFNVIKFHVENIYAHFLQTVPVETDKDDVRHY